MKIKEIFKKKETKLDKEIESVLECLNDLDPSTEEYAAATKNLDILVKLKSTDEKKTVSPDTIVMVAANLVGLLLVLNYEKADIITSKAFGMIFKGKA